MPLTVSKAETLCSRSIAEKRPGWTATSVMRVYIEAASQAHERLNVLTEIMFLDALKKAQALDAEFERTGKVAGLCESRARSSSAAMPSHDFRLATTTRCPPSQCTVSPSRSRTCLTSKVTIRRSALRTSAISQRQRTPPWCP